VIKYNGMKERLLQLLDMEHLTPSKFADLIGVQRSSVSHILSGRNKPSFDFLQKTLKTFPGLKADWLMLGEGHMYEHMGREAADLFDQPIESKDVNDTLSEENVKNSGTGPINTMNQSQAPPVNPLSDMEEMPSTIPEPTVETRKLVQVMLFYDDDTFTTYKPSQ